MNERLAELIEKADSKFVRRGVHLVEVVDQEKFAETLIHECLQHLTNIGQDYAREQLEKHFGIK